MSKSTFSGVKIVGISCGVPKTVIANDYFNQFMDPKIVKNIEIAKRDHSSMTSCKFRPPF